MAKIEKFLPILMKVEGGYANVAGDKGGKTKWGVTERTFKTYYPKTSQTILSMTYDGLQHTDKKISHSHERLTFLFLKNYYL